MTDFDELETIADSVRAEPSTNAKARARSDKGLKGLKKYMIKNQLANNEAARSGLRYSAHQPSLPKLKFMRGENGSN